MPAGLGKVKDSLELKITKEKVLAGAEKCPQAKQVLKEMFPEVFKDDKYLDLSKLVLATNKWSKDNCNRLFTMDSVRKVLEDTNCFAFCHTLIAISNEEDGKMQNNSFWLNSGLDWQIKENDYNLYLVPRKKKYE